MNNTRLTVFRRVKGTLQESAHFALDEMPAFDAYLAECHSKRFSLLTDLAEEDFQSDLIPHMGRADRYDFLDRRLDQVYRTTPYRRAVVQKFAGKGEFQDRVLLSGLTLPAPIDHIVNALAKKNLVLQGIYSAALLAGAMIQKSGTELQHYLLVSFVPGGGMRQTYLSCDGIQFSRLSSLSDDFNLRDPKMVAAFIVAETLRARQYLSSKRLLDRDARLQLVIAAPGGMDCLAEVSAGLTRAGEGAQYAVEDLPLAALAQKLGLPPVDSLSQLLCSWLLLKSLPNQYAPFHQLRLARWQNRGKVLRWAGVGILLVTAVCSLFIWQRANRIRQDNDASLVKIQQASEQVSYFSRLLQQNHIRDPAFMSGANLLYQQQLLLWPDMETLARQVSQILPAFPELILDELHWDAGKSGVKNTAAVMDLTGRVEPFSLPYREALARVDLFRQQLAKLPGVKVEALTLPIDVSSKVAVGEKLKADDAQRIDFVLRLSWEQKQP
ncbi:MAG: hypothetical protein ACRCU9_10315 [Iodobacter sp.]